MPRREISEERKAAYYFGMLLSAVGLLLFLSVFVSGCANFGNFSDFDGQMKSSAARALGGMACIAIGQVMMNIGRSGLAGSGVKLDPQEARTDLEPWSRMQGGVIGDALDEAGINLGGSADQSDLPFDEQLRRLKALKTDGLITPEEYQEAKRKILDNVG